MILFALPCDVPGYFGSEEDWYEADPDGLTSVQRLCLVEHEKGEHDVDPCGDCLICEPAHREITA